MESVVARFYYYGARYYNPRESIFLSVDPMAEMMPNVSPYAYTLQNPVKFIDPTGMIPGDPEPENDSTISGGRRANDSDRRETTKDNTGEYNDSDLNYIKKSYQKIVSQGSKAGYDFSSDNLEHFLGNSGKPKLVSATFLLKNNSVKNLVKSNLEKIWNGSSGIVNKLGIGESVIINKYYEDSADALYGTDLFYGSGGFTITTSADLKVERTGMFSWSVKGYVTNEWNDYYDWHTGLGVYIPGVGVVPDQWGQALVDNERAKNFKMYSVWSSKVDFNVYGIWNVSTAGGLNNLKKQGLK